MGTSVQAGNKVNAGTREDAQKLLTENERDIRSKASDYLLSRLGILTPEQIEQANKEAQSALEKAWSDNEAAKDLWLKGGMETSIMEEYAEAFLNSYKDAIAKGLNVSLTDEQKNLLAPMMEEIQKLAPQAGNRGNFVITELKATKDGLIDITALVRNANGEYEKLLLTYKQLGEASSIVVSNTEAISSSKISQELKEKLDPLAKPKDIDQIGSVVFESESWYKLLDLAKEFHIETDQILKIIRNVDREGQESFQFFTRNGARTTLGINSSRELFVKEKTLSMEDEMKEFDKLTRSLSKSANKAFEGDVNSAEDFIAALERIQEIWKNLLSYQNAGLISDDELTKHQQLYTNEFATIGGTLGGIKTEGESQNYLNLYEETLRVFKDLQPELDLNQQSLDSISQAIVKIINNVITLGKIEKEEATITSSKANDWISKMGTYLTKNSSIPKEYKAQIESLIQAGRRLQDQFGDAIPRKEFTDVINQFKEIKSKMDEMGYSGKSMFDKIGRALKNSLIQTARMYLSWYRIIAYIRQGAQEVIQMDTALTKMSYTMNVTESQLKTMSKDMVSMAKELSTSVANIEQIYQIYANLKTSQSELEQIARPTAILANLSGSDAATAADQIQAVLNQFELTADSAMHIVDVYDKISANIKVDYSKGIQGMSEAVQNVGNYAHEAGLSFEQLSSIIAKTMEKTRQEGSQIGNAIKTIAVRISKANKLADSDEVNNETLSNASAALHKVGVEVYKVNGEYRQLDTILSELAQVWPTLNDAQRADISFKIAATRQTALLSAILSTYNDAMELSTEALNANGNAMANQEKYAESLAGQIQSLKTEFSALWVDLLSSNSIKDLVEAVKEMIVNLQNSATGLKPVIDLLAELLKVISKIIGIIPTSGLIASILGLKFGKTITTAIVGLRSLIKELGATEAVIEHFGTSLGTLLASVATNPIGAIIIASTTIYSIVNAINKKVEEAADNIDNTYQKLKQETQDINSYITQIEELKQKLDSSNLSENDAYTIKKNLLKIQDDLITSYGIEADNIDILNEKYETTVGLLKDTQKELAKTYVLEHKGEYENVYNDLITTNLWEQKNNIIGHAPEFLNNDFQELFKKYNFFTEDIGGSGHVEYIGSDITKGDDFSNLIKDLEQLADKYPKAVEDLQKILGNKLLDYRGNTGLQKKITAQKTYIEMVVASTDAYDDYVEAYNQYQNMIAKGTVDPNKFLTITNTIKSFDKVLDNELSDKDVSIRASAQRYATNAISNIDLSEGYRLLIRSAIHDKNNTLVQNALTGLFNNGNWSDALLQANDYGTEFSDYITTILRMGIAGVEIPYSEIDSVIEEVGNYFQEQYSGNNNNIPKISLAEWYKTDSDIDSSKKWKDVTDAVFSGLDKIGEFVKTHRHAGEDLIGLDVFNETGVDDSIFKKLGVGDLNSYLTKYEDDAQRGFDEYIKAVTEAFLKAVGDTENIDGFELILEKLGISSERARGGAWQKDIDLAIAAYEKIYDVYQKAKNGGLFTGEEVSQLEQEYGSLADKLTIVGDKYKIDTDALKDLTNQSVKSANEQIAAQIETTRQVLDGLRDRNKALASYRDKDLVIQIEMTQNTIDQVENRCAALGIEANLLKSVLSSYNILQGTPELENSFKDMFGDNYEEVLEILEVYNGLDEALQALEDQKALLESLKNGVKIQSDLDTSSKNSIDWIANSLENITRGAESAKQAYDNLLTTFGSKTAVQTANKQLGLLNDALAAQEAGAQKAADSYQNEIDKLGLSKDQINKIENVALGREDAWKIQDFGNDTDLYNKMNEGLDLTKKRIDAEKQIADLQHQQTENNIQKLQNWSDYYSAVIDKFEAKISNTSSVKKQQKYVDKIYEATKAQYEQDEEIAKLKGDLVTLSKLEAEEELKLNELLVRRSQIAIDAIQKKYDRIISEFENRQSILEHGIAMTEANGSMVSTKYYEALIDNERDSLDAMLKERKDLIAKLNDINTEKEGGLDAWWATKDAIDQLTASIYESEEALIEYKNAMRQIQWDLFDRISDTIHGIAEESEYLISLFANDDMYEYTKELWGNDGSKTKVYYGGMTDEGLATLGLYELQMKTNKELAEDYAREIEELNEEIAKRPTDLTLIDRRNELIEKQRESIQAVENEKQAIIDLIQDGYDKQLESMETLISKYMEALNAEKSLYDYQKNIKKQTKDILKLRKQMAAYANDTSEEARGKLQRLTVELQEAEEGLQDTQYDRYLSDQQEILDRMYNTFEDYIDDKMSDRDKLLKEMSAKVDDNQKKIRDEISKKTTELGSTLSQTMKDIWKEPLNNGKTIAQVISDKDIGLMAIANSTKSTDTLLAQYFDNYNKDPEQLRTKITNISNKINSIDTNLGAIADSLGTKKTTTSDATVAGDKVALTPKKYFMGEFSSYNLKSMRLSDAALRNLYNHMPDLVAQQSFDSWSDPDERLKAMTVWLKKNGYASGVHRIKRDELAWTQEKGLEAIIRPSDGAILTPLAKNDSVLNVGATQNIWDMANNPIQFIKDNLSFPVDLHSSTGGNFDIQQSMAITLPNVMNYNEFVTALQHDKKFERMMQDITVNQLTGGSKLAKYKYNY